LALLCALLCMALAAPAAAAFTTETASDIEIQITPPSGGAAERTAAEVAFLDRAGTGVQTALVRSGGGDWEDVTGALARTENRYTYPVEIAQSGTVSARAIGPDGTVFEKSAYIQIDEPEPAPLTPDGQGTVLDNATEADGKEFFTITTPDENVFYLVIDRQKESENVYFLNAVTESDLMALAEKDKEDAAATAPTVTPVPEPEPEPACTCQEKCEAGAVNTDCPVCLLSHKDCEGEAPAPSEVEKEAEPEKKHAGGVIFVLLAVLAAGGAGYYLKIYKPKHEMDDAEDFDELTGETVNEDDEIEAEARRGSVRVQVDSPEPPAGDSGEPEGAVSEYGGGEPEEPASEDSGGEPGDESGDEPDEPIDDEPDEPEPPEGGLRLNPEDYGM